MLQRLTKSYKSLRLWHIGEWLDNCNKAVSSGRVFEAGASKMRILERRVGEESRNSSEEQTGSDPSLL